MNIEGNQYDVLHMKLEMHQTVDDAGSPSSPVQFAYLYVELDWVDNEFLLAWVTAPSQTYNFEIEQFGTNGKLKEIRFENAYCTELTERYNVGAMDSFRQEQVQNFITCLFITAGRVQVDDAELQNF